MTDQPQPQPIDYGSQLAVKVDYDGSEGLEVIEVDNTRLKGLKMSDQLPKLEAYVEHMRANGYEPAYKLPELTGSWRQAQGTSSAKFVYFRRIADVKATPAEIAMSLVKGTGAGTEPPTRTAEQQKAADDKMRRFIRSRF